MAEYNIVKYCGLCKKRYILNKKDIKTNYCTTCQKRINKQLKNEM